MIWPCQICECHLGGTWRSNGNYEWRHDVPTKACIFPWLSSVSHSHVHLFLLGVALLTRQPAAQRRRGAGWVSQTLTTPLTHACANTFKYWFWASLFTGSPQCIQPGLSVNVAWHTVVRYVQTGYIDFVSSCDHYNRHLPTGIEPYCYSINPAGFLFGRKEKRWAASALWNSQG